MTQQKGHFQLKLRHILFLAFVIRVLLIPFFSDDFNFWAYRIPSSFLAEGFNPYTAITKDPTLYWINPWRQPPTYLVLLVPAYLIGSILRNEIMYFYAVKIPIVIADIISTFFIYKIAHYLCGDVEKAKKICMLCAFNPATIFVSAIWGESDPIPIALTIISLYYFLCSESKNHLKLSAFFLGWGITFKLYPVFIVPAFLFKLRQRSKALVFTFFASLPIVLSSFPFLLWDPGSFFNRLILHNLSGTFPLFPALLINDPIFHVAFAVFASIMFLIAYLRKSSIIANIVLAFLALYIALGGMLAANYFLWVIPFGCLLLVDRKIKSTKGSFLLPFLPLASIIWALIYNGPFNSVEGVTGIFYWPYHWLRSKVVIFRILPIVQNLAPLFVAINIVMIFYLFFVVSKIAPPLTLHTSIKINSLSFMKKLKKRESWVLASVLILVVSLFLFSSIVFYEPMKPIPVLSPSTFVFFDDFSNSLIGYQWWFSGEGTYTLHPSSSPSHITLNASDTAQNRAYIFRGWWFITNGFFKSSDAVVKFRFRFSNFAANASDTVIAESDGGYFGATIQGTLNNFIYSDKISNRTSVTANLDYDWHTLEIDYKDGRQIYFDDEFVTSYNYSSTFSMLSLGNSESAETFGGSVSIDWVKVTLKDFPTGVYSNTLAWVTLAFPFTLLLLINVVLYFPKGSFQHLVSERQKIVSKPLRDGE